MRRAENAAKWRYIAYDSKMTKIVAQREHFVVPYT